MDSRHRQAYTYARPRKKCAIDLQRQVGALVGNGHGAQAGRLGFAGRLSLQ